MSRPGWRRRATLWLAASAALAATAGPSARDVQAAFLCSFPQFVVWPQDDGEQAVSIGVFGDDGFAEAVERIVGDRSASARKLEIRRLTDLAAARDQWIVFLGAGEAQRAAELLAAVSGSSVLTVSDLPGFAARGGIIGFVIEERRVRFEINVAAAERAGLRVSSRLLRLAHVVEPPGEPAP